jgi:DNA-binding CsgD family transcriptional regulator
LDHTLRGEAAPEDPLTPRELEVTKLIAEGHTSEETAEMLVISLDSTGSPGPRMTRDLSEMVTGTH